MTFRLLMATLLGGCMMPVVAQRGSNTQYPAQTGSGTSGSATRRSTLPDDSDPDEMLNSPVFRHRVEEGRKLARKKRMVDDADRLMVLTQQFQADVAGRSELTDADLKRLDDIAKLARSVKDQMRQ